MIGYEIKGDIYYFLYREYFFEKDKDVVYRTKNKKIRSVVGRIFNSNIYSYREDNYNIFLKLKEPNDQYWFDLGASWGRFLKFEINFHPMIRVDPAMLTGVYFGSRSESSNIDGKIFDKFPNLKRENIMRAEICQKEFKHNLVKVEL